MQDLIIVLLTIIRVIRTNLTSAFDFLVRLPVINAFNFATSITAPDSIFLLLRNL